MLPHHQTLAFATGKLLTAPVWWFFLFWLPKYFTETFNLELTTLAVPLVIIFAYLTALVVIHFLVPRLEPACVE